MAEDIHITRIIRQTSEVALQLSRLHFSHCRPSVEAWEPAVNAVRYSDRIEVCVDLAGVELKHVRLSLEGQYLHIRGLRPALDANCRGAQDCRILMMEIDDGPFERFLHLPVDLEMDPDCITTRQQNGLLWITIPINS